MDIKHRNPADIRMQPNRMYCRFHCFWCGVNDKHGSFLFIVNHEGDERYICDECARKAMPNVYRALSIAGDLWYHMDMAPDSHKCFLDISKTLRGAGYPVAGYVPPAPDGDVPF